MSVARWLKPECCREAINFITAKSAGWHVPLMEAVEAGVVDVALLPNPSAMPSLTQLRNAKLPVIVWISDDGLMSLGPSGWRGAVPLARWATAAVIHACSGEVENYRDVVRAALAVERVLLVDTASRHALAWAELVKGKPALVYVPRQGAHPIQSETQH